MYFIKINISKCKHICFILTEIRIGFKATAHYALNLKPFLKESHYSFIEFNPVLLTKFNKSQTLRQTKTDAIDCAFIAR